MKHQSTLRRSLMAPLLCLLAFTCSTISYAQCWKAVASSSSSDHTVAIAANGTLWAWGYNPNGQLGIGNNTNHSSPVQVGTDTNWQSVACGGYHTVAIKTDGSLWAWGDNTSGQLGSGNMNNEYSPVQVGSATNWRMVACGLFHTVAMQTDGSLWAWGNNSNGQLGIGNNTDQNSPVRVNTGNKWRSVACGQYHSIAIQVNGTLWSWGYNSVGQLGNGNLATQKSPLRISSNTNWRSVACGGFHSLAIKTDGSLWGWGYNKYGQLNSGYGVTQKVPGQLNSASDWQSVAGGSYHTIAIKTDGSLWAWGYNSDGQLGIGDAANQGDPMQVGDYTNWQSVAGGRLHNAAVQTTGTVSSWGSNHYGQLGIGNTISQNSPVELVCPYSRCTTVTSQSNITRCSAYLWNGINYTVAGTYAFRTTNAAGCDSTAMLNLTLAPSGNDTQTVTSCTPYSWNGATYKKSGTYNTTISASGGCKIFATLNLTIPVLTATITTTVPTCVNTATATITVNNNNNGTAPYLYKNGATGTYQSSNEFTGLKAGIAYRIYWQDANGCTGNSDLITISQPTPIAVSTSFTSPTCYGQKTATITADATNGVAGYMYKNGSTGTLQSSSTFTGLLAGVNYRIYAQDATGCTGFSDLVNVPQTPAVAATFTTTDATCFNTATGAATITATGGSGTYQYKNGASGTLQMSNVLTGLRAGTQYRAYVVDNNGCTGNTALFTVGQPAAFLSATSSVAPSCNGATDGSATITPMDGLPPYQFKYSTTGSLQANPTFTGLAAGATFRLYFQDATGCIGTGDQVTIPTSENPCFATFARTAVGSKVTNTTAKNKLEVNVSPNPSNTQFTVIAHADNTQPITISVLDVNGRSLYQSKGTTEQPFRFGSSFAPGTYLVEVRQGNEVKMLKAVKMK